MHTRTFLVLFTILFFQLNASSQVGVTNIIPKPMSAIEKKGVFVFNNATSIQSPAAFIQARQLLKSQLISYDFEQSNQSTRVTYLQIENHIPFAKEGYTLTITPTQITIAAKSVQGAILGTNTLVQLQLLQSNPQLIPCGEIIDSPRFAYRGMHLDVSRNFYPLSFIKKYLDLMAIYKFNTFHWHLTDGPGWRLEIKKYPKLTTTAAFRPFNDWKSWWKSDRKYIPQGDPNAYGGFYTQVQAKEIVSYAAALGITVIPEIEMPGHTEEVLAVYPELSCSGIPYKSGAFCAGNEKTFEFIENVLTEVMDIFPSKYIHIGGDEVGKGDWKKCDKCQSRMKQASLKDENELQSYMIKRVEKFLNTHHRNLVGWDEIIEGGLTPNATVMSWRGDKGAIEAASQSHNVVMTPGETYFDAYQSNPTTQPEAIGGYLPIQRVYNYEPIPAALAKEQHKYIIGTQANLWSEYLPTTYQVEYMAFPRALALSEVAWTKKENKNLENFNERLQHQYLLLQRLNVNYYRPSTFVEIISRPDYTQQKNLISFVSEMYHPEIRYTTDGSDPTAQSLSYTQPFFIGGTTTIKASVMTNGTTLNKIAEFTANYHKAIGKKVTFNTPWSGGYPAQREQTLTNGIVGSITYSDKQWLGYERNMDITLDMDSITSINTIAIRFMQQNGPGVYFPPYVSVALSNDGITFGTPLKVTCDIAPTATGLLFKTFDFSLQGKTARYIKIQAANDRKEFLFVDEVMVN